MIKFEVRNQDLRLVSAPSKIVGDSQGYLRMDFTFTSDWDRAVKMVLFFKDQLIEKVVLDSNGECQVPASMITGEGSTGITVLGFNRPGEPNLFITTDAADITYEKAGGPLTLVPGTTTEDFWGDILSQALTDIDDRKAEAVNAVNAESTAAKCLVDNARAAAVADVKAEGVAAIGGVNAAGQDALDKIHAVSVNSEATLNAIEVKKTDALNSLNMAKDDSLKAVDTAKTAAVNTINSINNGAEKNLQDMARVKQEALNAMLEAETLHTTAINNAGDEVQALTVQSKSEINLAKQEAISTINAINNGAEKNLQDMATAKQEALNTIATREATAVGAVQTAEKTATDNIGKINTDAVQALADIKLAKQQAINTVKTTQGMRGEKGDPGKDGMNGADGAKGADGTNGIDGLSAYQVAVKNGFKGTEEQWLQSLKGADGKPGKDGMNGTDGIKGTDGKDGLPGADGKSAYDVAVKNGFGGSEAEWLDSLKGKAGAVPPLIKELKPDMNLHELTEDGIYVGYIGPDTPGIDVNELGWEVVNSIRPVVMNVGKHLDWKGENYIAWQYVMYLDMSLSQAFYREFAIGMPSQDYTWKFDFHNLSQIVKDDIYTEDVVGIKRIDFIHYNWQQLEDGTYTITLDIDRKYEDYVFAVSGIDLDSHKLVNLTDKTKVNNNQVTITNDKPVNGQVLYYYFPNEE